MHPHSIALHRVAVPFHEPFRISSGSVSVKEAIIVVLHTTDGIVGYGEASPMGGGFYSAETPDSTWTYLVDHLVPALFELDTISPAAVVDLLNQFPEEPFARAGIEGAVWDAYARGVSMPLNQLFGGTQRSIPSGAGIGLFDTVDELLKRVERFLLEGYVRIKIKIEPGWDVEPLRAIRAKFGAMPLMVDANASYNLKEHAETLRSLDEFDLLMIEQPLAKEAFDDAAALQRMLHTPLCADESAYSLEALERIILQESANIINIKVQRVGGLANARSIAERAMQAGLPCWLGTMPELGIASQQGLQLATHPAFTYPTDVEASARWYVEDIIDPPITIDRAGSILPCPYAINSDFLTNRTKQTRTFSR